LKNFFGAFADGAILFPLLAALSLQGALPADRLLLTAGLAYIASGVWFRIPMPVQPLKSIAIAAVAVHASGMEIRVSGAVLGLVCLILYFAVKSERIRKWVEAVPSFFIRALQTALGVILAIEGIKILISLPFLEKIAGAAVLASLFIFSSLPLLGIFATVGLVVGVFLSSGIFTGNTASAESLATAQAANALLRPSMVIGLVVPQIALTFANSVLSTKDVAHAYYGEGAKRVTVPALFASIGLGNLVVAAIGGLPYCHGAGGLTAHYRGGARSYHANLMIGGTLIAFAAITYFGHSLVLHYPLFLLGSLLVAIGWFHFGLVRMQKIAEENGKLLLVALVAGFTQTMTWPLILAVAICLYTYFFEKENFFKKAAG
jgi:SulP family sulfate permease